MGNKKYDKEFKLEAIRLAMEPGSSATKIERDLGIGQGVISRWKRQLRHDGRQAFPGKGHLKPDDEFVRKLKRDNERLRRERDILIKALAIFSTDPLGIRVHKRAPHSLECFGDVPSF